MSSQLSIHDHQHVQHVEESRPLLTDGIIQCHHCHQHRARPNTHSQIREPLEKPKAVRVCFWTIYEFTALRTVFFCSSDCKREFLSAKLCCRCRRVDMPLAKVGRQQVCAVPPREGVPSCKLMATYFF